MLLNFILGILFCISVGYIVVLQKRIEESRKESVREALVKGVKEVEEQEGRLQRLKEKNKQLIRDIERRALDEAIRFEGVMKGQKELAEAKVEAYKNKRELDIGLELVTKVTEADEALERFRSSCATIMQETEEHKLEILSELEEYRKKREVINEAIIREREIEEKKDFYKIQISKSDIGDIQKLKEIGESINRKEIVAKIIWEVIASRPTLEMIKRITEGRAIAGIYRATYLPTGESYIGRTTNIQSRIRNHVATAVGLERAASSTFHTHMERNGFWNYTWEVLEEVDRTELNDREKYWIDFYGTKDFGLNQKRGG